MGFPLPDAGAVTEDSGLVGGFLTVSGDVDYGPIINNDGGQWTAETIVGAFGSQLVIDADGNWTYTADNSNATNQALDTGESLTEVFTISSTVGDTTITITINGVDEPPCFVSGTLIETPFGPRPIEDLKAGDEVITRDNGIQRILWAGARRIDLADPETRDRFQPIRLKRGSLGPGLPDRDLLLSPMHRVLIRDPLVSLLTGAEEILCPAHLLANGESIQHETRCRDVTYHHLLFETHQVLFSSACQSESFFPGRIGLEGFADQTREEVLSLFPDLRSLPESYGPTARQIAKRYEAALLCDALKPRHGLFEVLLRAAA